MTREKLQSKISRENMYKINKAVDELVSSLSKSIDTNKTEITMAIWASVNFDLLLNHKSYPEDNIQKVMNGVTVTQNEYIRDNFIKVENE